MARGGGAEEGVDWDGGEARGGLLKGGVPVECVRAAGLEPGGLPRDAGVEVPGSKTHGKKAEPGWKTG